MTRSSSRYTSTVTAIQYRGAFRLLEHLRHLDMTEARYRLCICIGPVLAAFAAVVTTATAAAREAKDSPAPAAQPAAAEAESPGNESGTTGTSSPLGTIAGVVVGPDDKLVSSAEVYLGDSRVYFPEFYCVPDVPLGLSCGGRSVQTEMVTIEPLRPASGETWGS
jgi:hypothetical protein